jgi:putative spermidine/putrescine transport system substrate-binding protein
MRLCDKGYVEPIDHGRLLKNGADGSVPADDFIPELHDCFIPEIIFSTVLAYNQEMFDGEAPDSVADVWNLERFPGKRALEKIPAANLEWALMADGVEHDRVYEVLRTREGVNRAFESLDRIKDDVIWWTKGAQAPQLLADQEVSVASSYNGRIFNARVAEDQPFRIIWDGQVYEADGWVVPKGQLDGEVREFVRFATDTQRLADQARYISYGPARRSSASEVGRHAEHGVSMSPHMPTNPDNLETAIPKSARFWADRGDSLAERFNAWLAL